MVPVLAIAKNVELGTVLIMDPLRVMVIDLYLNPVRIMLTVLAMVLNLNMALTLDMVLILDPVLVIILSPESGPSPGPKHNS